MRCSKLLPRFSAVAIFCVATPASAATPYTTDAARSTLSFIATQSGGPVAGRFKDFKATIIFSDDDLAHSSFDVSIATKSLDTGEDDRDEAIRGAELFAVEQFPTAKFAATSFKRKGPGRYEAQGRLTIRDVTRNINLPFTLQTGPRESRLTGGIALRRLDYGVGQGQWKATKKVKNEVKVKFELFLIPTTP